MESADVGEIPPPLHPSRRAACGLDLHLFLATYFPHSTGKDVFSPDHCRVIDRIEHCLRSGGRFVKAVYRGFAKTTITELAALWAALYGYRQFISIFGADEAAANQLIDSIARELEENDLLAADFPEVCLAFQHLDGKPQRGRSQTQAGATDDSPAGGRATRRRAHSGAAAGIRHAGGRVDLPVRSNVPEQSRFRHQGGVAPRPRSDGGLTLVRLENDECCAH